MFACGDDASTVAVHDDEDADGDGFAESVDCDDGDASINTDAEELCDAVDRNCDGSPDDGATDGKSWFRDGDGDGFGDDGQVLVACAAPPDHIAAGGDCDDSSSSALPGGEETCDGVLDEDCDGEVDEADAVDATERRGCAAVR